MRKHWIIFLTVLGVMSVALYFWAHKPQPVIIPDQGKFREITGGTTTVKVELARTPPEQEKGLSGRTSLPDDHGLLFIFDHADKYGFWMPDMKFPIDMIWIDSNWQIVSIAPSVTPESYPHVFTPKAPASYVLEVSSGKAARSGWHDGAQFNFAP